MQKFIPKVFISWFEGGGIFVYEYVEWCEVSKRKMTIRHSYACRLLCYSAFHSSTPSIICNSPLSQTDVTVLHFQNDLFFVFVVNLKPGLKHLGGDCSFF